MCAQNPYGSWVSAFPWETAVVQYDISSSSSLAASCCDVGIPQAILCTGTYCRHAICDRRSLQVISSCIVRSNLYAQCQTADMRIYRSKGLLAEIASSLVKFMVLLAAHTCHSNSNEQDARLEKAKSAWLQERNAVPLYLAYADAPALPRQQFGVQSGASLRSALPQNLFLWWTFLRHLAGILV
eukprot:6477593-Amphidinium_carterae.1